MNQYLSHEINESINDFNSILNYICIAIFSVIQKMILLFAGKYFSFEATYLGIQFILVFPTESSHWKYTELLNIGDSLTECSPEKFGKDIPAWLICNVPRPPNKKN